MAMKTAAQILKDARLELGIDLDEVAEKTKIPLRYLKTIEMGKYHLLPGESYAKLYVRSYAEFLGICKDDCVSFFRRDLGEGEIGLKRKELRKKQSVWEKVKKAFKIVFNKISLDPNRTKIIGLLILAFLLFGYLLYQYLSFNTPPEVDVSLSCQKDNGQDWVVVEGNTDPENSVSIDGVVVDLTAEGEFSERLLFVAKRDSIDIKVESPLGNLLEETKKINCLDN
jgi:cytoskeletal protein RodZ